MYTVPEPRNVTALISDKWDSVLPYDKNKGTHATMKPFSHLRNDRDIKSLLSDF
jgi:hypothetical protein